MPFTLKKLNSYRDTIHETKVDEVLFSQFFTHHL